MNFEGITAESLQGMGDDELSALLKQLGGMVSQDKALGMQHAGAGAQYNKQPQIPQNTAGSAMSLLGQTMGASKGAMRQPKPMSAPMYRSPYLKSLLEM